MLQQKILIVDDEKILTELVFEALHREGFFNIEKACNGEEGFEKYKSFSPDLVLMDIEMPVMDGYESSSRIKSFDPEAKIMVITGNAYDDRARRTLSEGIAFKVLEKPLRLLDLRRIVRENLPALSQAL
jgi:two-component system chemotaxis response regulator CheY